MIAPQAKSVENKCRRSTASGWSSFSWLSVFQWCCQNNKLRHTNASVPQTYMEVFLEGQEWKKCATHQTTLNRVKREKIHQFLAADMMTVHSHERSTSKCQAGFWWPPSVTNDSIVGAKCMDVRLCPTFHLSKGQVGGESSGHTARLRCPVRDCWIIL